MPTYNLSAFAGAGAQFFDDNGAPLVGGKVYTYASGTTTPRATYTTSAGTVANTNPIILDAAGRTPNEIWLIAGSPYKFILRTSTDVLIGTYDGVPSINDSFSTYNLLSSVAGTNTITATATPTLTSYQAGATYSFIAANTNTGATTISIDGLAAKSITKNGSVALTAGDIQAGKMMLIEYDGTVFQLMNNIVYGSALTNATINSLTSPLTVANGGTGAGTFTANAVLLGNNTAAFQTVAPGTANNVLTSNGTTWVSAASSIVVPTAIGQIPFSTNGSTYTATQKIAQGTAVASTSGTSIDFTGIPSWVKRITVMLSGVSTDGTSPLLIQVGSGSITTSGYTSGSFVGVTSGMGAILITSSAGFIHSLQVGDAAAVSRYGSFILSLLGSNTWASTGSFIGGSYGAATTGGVALGGVLDRVRITTVSGTDNFDAGSINIMYE